MTELFFEVLSRVYEKQSIIPTTNPSRLNTESRSCITNT